MGRRQAAGLGVGDTASTLPPGSLGAPKSQASVKRQQTQNAGEREAAGTGRRSEGPGAAPRPRRRQEPAGKSRGESPLTWGRPRRGGAEAERIRSGTRRRPGAAAAGEELGRGERRKGAGHRIHLRAPAPADAGHRQGGAGVFPSPSPLPPPSSSSSCARLQNKPGTGKRAARDTSPRVGGLRQSFLKLSNQYSLVLIIKAPYANQPFPKPS